MSGQKFQSEQVLSSNLVFDVYFSYLLILQKKNFTQKREPTTNVIVIPLNSELACKFNPVEFDLLDDLARDSIIRIYQKISWIGKKLHAKHSHVHSIHSAPDRETF